ncbi:MAG: NAD(P)H-quinone oxidoreductase [Acidobacteria bacterium]|nr:NAD(P)H-quinone oxidoreductase [Acidobacteriota bacterium]
MRAVVITRPGGPEVLEVRDAPAPQPAAGEVLVRVMASALNRADVLQREGRYPAPPGAPADIPGIEFAGEVAALGQQTTSWHLGQRVFGITGGGGHAEYLVAHEHTLAEVPPNLSWTEAAAIPEAFITAQDALWEQAALRPSERVLIHAVGSGVGLAAVELVRSWGAVPFGTARSEEKITRARGYGLEDGVVLRESLDALAERAAQWTVGRGFDVVLDLVGGPYVTASISVLGLKGRLMLVGTLAGGRAELDLRAVLGKRLRLMGTVLRSRLLEEKIAATRAFAAEVVPLFAQQKLRAVVDSEFPLAEIRPAHQRMESNATFGKVVIRING